jgi:hypothetical protein
MTKQLGSLVIATLVAATCLMGCGGRSVGKTTFGVGSNGSTWSREVTYSVDGSGKIESQQTTATITFSQGTLVIEKARVLFNEDEIAKVEQSAKVVDVQYSAGVLTITADCTRIHEAKLRK